MKECKFCEGKKLVKNGIVRNMQRYCCNECKNNQVLGDRRVKYSIKFAT